MHLATWAAKWGISIAALQDLQRSIGELDVGPNDPEFVNLSEKAIVNQLRIRAGEQKWPLWRNNVGAGRTEAGTWVRYGLANDSPAVNKRLKSADLIGCRPVVITQDMVGKRFGQFVSVEAKEGNWHYRGDEHEQAQLAWINLVNTLGGWAIFANTPDALGPSPVKPP